MNVADDRNAVSTLSWNYARKLRQNLSYNNFLQVPAEIAIESRSQLDIVILNHLNWKVF